MTGTEKRGNSAKGQPARRLQRARSRSGDVTNPPAACHSAEASPRRRGEQRGDQQESLDPSRCALPRAPRGRDRQTAAGRAAARGRRHAGGPPFGPGARRNHVRGRESSAPRPVAARGDRAVDRDWAAPGRVVQPDLGLDRLLARTEARRRDSSRRAGQGALGGREALGAQEPAVADCPPEPAGSADPRRAAWRFDPPAPTRWCSRTSAGAPTSGCRPPRRARAFRRGGS